MSAFQGKKVLVTGHTGFKGVWLCKWLELLGAEVTGVALDPSSDPNHFDKVEWKSLKDIRADIRDAEKMNQIFEQELPELVFHLAAQAIVRDSYDDPVGTYATNVMGTMHVLEAARKISSVKAFVAITSDKCYENKEQSKGYVESDPMGGYDPYSSSKGCNELLLSSYRNSFLNDGSGYLLASVRAGNVIGGGDWSNHRLLPDILSAAFQGETVVIRNPSAVRPWQHVMEALYGYLMLADGLLKGKQDWACGWNFGPEYEDCVSVKEIVEGVLKECPDLKVEMNKVTSGPHEANLLFLDTTKAKTDLGWKPNWRLPDGLRNTVKWYESFYKDNSIATESQILEFMETL